MFEFFIRRAGTFGQSVKQVVISVITVISVIGVAAGVMALVIAVAITNGFSSSLQKNPAPRDRCRCSIQEKEPGEGIEDWEQIRG